MSAWRLALSAACAGGLFGCSGPATYDARLRARGLQILKEHQASSVTVKVRDLFAHDGDDVCIADSVATAERLATNSDPKFANIIPAVASQTREFTETEDWYVFYVSGARIKEKFRINGWEAHIKVSMSVGRKETVAVYRKEADAIGCFSATDPLQIRTETLNGVDTVAVTFFANIAD